jgi:hypothetical protein
MNRFTRHIALSLLVLLSLTSHAQWKRYEWTSSKELTSVPDSLKSQDAVVIRREYTIANLITDPYRSRYFSSESEYERIKFLSRKGIEDYSKIFIQKKGSEMIHMVDARTIKANGKVISLTEDDLKKLEYTDESKGREEPEMQVRFSLPGIEVGDEAEYIYTLVSPYLNTGDDVTLNTMLPCMKSTFIYIESKKITSEIKASESLAPPQRESDQFYDSYKWELVNLPAFELESFCIPMAEIPYVSFVVRHSKEYRNMYSRVETDVPIIPSNWPGIFETYDTLLMAADTTVTEDTAAFYKFIDEKAAVKSTKPFEHFRAACQYITDSVSLDKPGESSGNHPLLYYLVNKKTDKFHLMKIYHQLFHHFNMDYYICFGRNKYAGVMDSQFVAMHRIDETFFAVKDDEGQIHTVPVNPYITLYMDEMPYYLEGTMIVMVGSRRDTATQEREVIFKKPTPSTAAVNYHNERMKVKISFSSDSVTCEYKDIFSGTIFQEYRMQLLAMEREKKYEEPLHAFYPEASLDSAFVTHNTTHPPSEYVTYYFKQPTLVNEIDSSLYSLALKKLFHFTIHNSVDKPRKFDYYTEYKYHHQCDFQFSFDAPFDILNAAQMTKTLKNNFGAFDAWVRKVDEKTLAIHFDYAVSAFRLPKEQYSELKDLEKEFESYINSSILIKKL